MSHWATIVMEAHMNQFQRREDFDRRRREQVDAALDRALLDRSRLVDALRDLVTALQLEVAHPTMRLLQSEARAVAALTALHEVEPAVAPV